MRHLVARSERVKEAGRQLGQRVYILLNLPRAIRRFLTVGVVATPTVGRRCLERCRGIIEFPGRCLLSNFTEAHIRGHGKFHGVIDVLGVPVVMDLPEDLL